MKNLCGGTQCGGFQFLLILDLWGIGFYAVVVFSVGKDLLFKYVLGRCNLYVYRISFECFFFNNGDGIYCTSATLCFHFWTFAYVIKWLWFLLCFVFLRVSVCVLLCLNISVQCHVGFTVSNSQVQNRLILLIKIWVESFSSWLILLRLRALREGEKIVTVLCSILAKIRSLKKWQIFSPIMIFSFLGVIFNEKKPSFSDKSEHNSNFFLSFSQRSQSEVSEPAKIM